MSLRKRWLEATVIGAAMALVLAFYAWSAWQANAFGDWGDFDYYRLLVRGYKQGQLHLDIAPAPELLALADPYDPAQNGPFRLPDASYYKGKYYLYFGAAPAVTLMLPYSLLTGREMTTGAAVLCFSVLAYLTMAGLWLALRARYFPRSAAWVGALGVLGLGSATHVLALLRRPMWWELPIAAGIAFTLLALVGVYRAIHGQRPRLAMAGAGLCLGLAVASRPPCLFATPLLLAPLWWAWREEHETNGRSRGGSRRWWQMALAAAVPLAACGLAIMAHNYARFENAFEVGQNYQLSGAYESKLQHFSLSYLPHNLKVLFFQPLRWTWEFPFAMAWVNPANIPGYFGSEEVSGLAVTFPFVCLALAVPLVWRNRALHESRRLLAMMAAIAGYFLPVTFLLLCLFSTTARYIADFASALALLAGCGLLGLEHWVRSAPAAATRRIAWAAVAVPLVAASVAATVLIAVLLSFDYHGRAPSRENPARWASMTGAVERAIGGAGLWLGWYSGPAVLRVELKAQGPGNVETLWQSADPEAGERVLVEHGSASTLRFGYARNGAPTRWSGRVQWLPGESHRVDLQLPSLYPAAARWTDGFRRSVWFRERSAVAIWFDGIRVLATIAAPLADDQPAGGIEPATFSGRIAGVAKRLLREDELPERGAGAWIVGGPAPRPGQPPVALVTTGRNGAGNALSLEAVAPGTGRLVFDQWGEPPRSSPRFPLPKATELVVEIETAPIWPWSAVPDEEQPLSVWINGVPAWETRVRLHASSPEEVFLAANPIGATTCAAETPGWARCEPWPQVNGGTLRLRMVPAHPIARAGEPLVAVGALYGSDMIGLRATGVPGEVQVFYEHFGAAVHDGRKLMLESNQVHTADITLPSFNPDRFAEAAEGEVVVRIDGEEVLRVRSACYPCGDIISNLGRNRFGGSVCGPAFRGWLLDWRWMPVREARARAAAN